MIEIRNTYRILVGKPEWNRSLRTPWSWWILKDEDMRVWTGFTWHRIGTGGGLLGTREWTLEFHKTQGISWSAERLLACQEVSASRVHTRVNVCDFYLLSGVRAKKASDCTQQVSDHAVVLASSSPLSLGRNGIGFLSAVIVTHIGHMSSRRYKDYGVIYKGRGQPQEDPINVAPFWA
jgi:hypothetical protein